MEIVDILIIVFILAFAIVGFKRGVVQSLVAVVGFLAVIYLAYLLKNILGDFLVLNSPFTHYTFVPGGSYVLNVVTYEAIGFLAVLIVLGIIYKIVLTISGIFEKLLKITIILGIPSKILGLVVGAIEGLVIVYFILFTLTQPFIRVNLLENSKYAETILKKTPLLSNFAEDTFVIIDEINETVNTEDDFDLKLTDIILKRNITSPDVMQKLIDKKKLAVVGLQEVVDKYKTSEEATNEN